MARPKPSTPDRDPVAWRNERRRLGDLVPWPRNPRQIRADQARRLLESFGEFGQVETLAIGPDNEIYNGHQRLYVLAAEHGPDFEVDVRVSSRPLTEKEREKLVVILHQGAVGEWDFDLLANEFEVEDLLNWGFSERDLQLGGFDLDKEEFSGEETIPEKYMILVECEDEQAQVELLERFIAEGLKCRALLS